jgi:hypothetical protein
MTTNDKPGTTKPKRQTLPALRDPLQIQRAHDLLGVITVNQEMFINQIEPHTWPQITAALDVLCWLLGHQNNLTFNRNLADLEDLVTDTGLQLTDAGQIIYPARAPEEAGDESA